MPLSSTEKSRLMRQRRANSGLKELRGIWVAAGQEKKLKIKIKEWLNDKSA
jgi:hypothetical protein